jgi:dTDP-4-amino-4,6-dideoxygalactose transaminase
MAVLAINGGTPVRRRPFPAWPLADAHERTWLEKVLTGNRWFAGARGDDPESLGVLFGQRFARFVGVRFAFPVSNGSVSLEIALRSLGIGPGDEVIVPPYTFISTATSILMVGAIPVFADIDPRSYCLDSADCARKITPRTRALLPVHLGGQMADMPALKTLAQRHHLAILEDSAQAIGAAWAGCSSGAWGDVASFSFQANKTITSGEGGLVATNDEALAERVMAYRAFGRFSRSASDVGDRSSAFLSQRLSANYRLSEWQSAVLLGQLEKFPQQDAKRQKNAFLLTKQLAKLKGVEHIRCDAEGSRHAYYYYLVRYAPEGFAGASPELLARALAAEGVPFIPGDSVPLYRHPVFEADNLKGAISSQTLEHYRRAVNIQDPGCPVAEAACRSTLILRHQVLLAEESDMNDIAEAMAKVQAHAGELAPRKAGANA